MDPDSIAEGCVELPASLSDLTDAGRPGLAILIHQGRDAVSVHRVVHEPSGASRITPGRLATRADQAALGAIFRDEIEGDCWLMPERVLGVGRGHLTWFTRPEKRPMHLRIGDTEPQIIDVVWPALLFHARGGRLYIMAWSGKGRPNGEAKLYHAPLWNISADGRLCAGGGRPPTETTVVTIPAWEALVFDTSFTHINQDHTLRRKAATRNEELLAFWSDRADKRDAPPLACLNPAGVTLSDWLESINE